VPRASAAAERQPVGPLQATSPPITRTPVSFRQPVDRQCNIQGDILLKNSYVESDFTVDWQSLLKTDVSLLWAAVISAIISAAVSYAFRRSEIRFNLVAEYEQEQRKQLRALVGRYHGRLLQVASSLNSRLWNLYTNRDAGWLDANGQYTQLGYYLATTIHRFLSFCTFSRKFESEAIYLDGRIASKDDFLFADYLAALRWVLTDVALFKELPYNSGIAIDHFFSDSLRSCCDSCWVKKAMISLDDFNTRMETDRSLDKVVMFFDGLGQEEDRLRWDRIIAFHLLLLAFINRFGYKIHRVNDNAFYQVVQQIEHPIILRNLVHALPRLGISNDREARRITRAVRRLTKTK